MSWRGGPPETSRTQSCQCPSTSAAKTTVLPSGDSAGDSSRPARSVRRFTPAEAGAACFRNGHPPPGLEGGGQGQRPVQSPEPAAPPPAPGPRADPEGGPGGTGGVGKAFQVEGQVAGRLEPLLRVLLQAMRDDALQPRGDIAVHLGEGRRMVVDDRAHRLHGRLPLEGPARWTGARRGWRRTRRCRNGDRPAARAPARVTCSPPSPARPQGRCERTPFRSWRSGPTHLRRRSPPARAWPARSRGSSPARPGSRTRSRA